VNHFRILTVLVLGILVGILLAALLPPQQTAQAAGVVGDGTPGSCTQTAFDAALLGGGTITFSCGALPHTIILTNIKVIKYDTEIQGNNLITLSGGNTTSLFWVSAILTLRDITLTRGLGSNGGAILNFETVNLINSQITYSNASVSGGAIENSGIVNLTNSTLAHNLADNMAGALFNNGGEVTIENSQIYSNTAQNEGGAIKNTSGMVNINNSQLLDNKAMSCSLNTKGGGIWNSGTLTVTQSTIADSYAVNGGGIYNTGTLILADTTFDSNTANCTSIGNGGGILNDGQTTITGSRFIGNNGGSYGGGLHNGSYSYMTIIDSSFNQNQAWGGGGISNAGTLTLTTSTIYTNTAKYGGGIANGISGGTPNILILTNVTISDNTNTETSGGGGLQSDNGTVTITFATFAQNRGEAGVMQWGGQLIFKNSIITNSTPKNCVGTITSQGFNIADDYSCGFYQTGDRENTDPNLGILTDNGGPTLTHLLQQESPAIDGGQCVIGINSDQRGVSRPQDAACDIGALEVKIIPPVFHIFMPMIIQE
jgi:hypothetical protein